MSEIFLTLKYSLDLHAYADKIKELKNLLVEMFHKSTFQESKDRILNEFTRTNSTIRCVIATVALGMGMDIRDIDLVVHVGCPKSILSYWQEAGRCARDGRQGLSLILYNNFTLSLKTTTPEVKDMIKNKDNKCIRQQIIDFLSVDDNQTMVNKPCDGCDETFCKCSACLCCCVCSVKCKCRSDLDVEVFLST